MREDHQDLGEPGSNARSRDTRRLRWHEPHGLPACRQGSRSVAAEPQVAAECGLEQAGTHWIPVGIDELESLGDMVNGAGWVVLEKIRRCTLQQLNAV
jgi:hypothetical protein